jgi:hypothetical protein
MKTTTLLFYRAGETMAAGRETIFPEGAGKITQKQHILLLPTCFAPAGFFTPPPLLSMDKP